MEESTGEELREKRPRDTKEEGIEQDMKRKTWEHANREEALPALPSGLDEEDRQRVREINENNESMSGDNKSIRVSEDVDAMNDE